MRATATIPAWNVFGILPPIRPGSAAIARERSPSEDDADAIDWLARQDREPAIGGTSDEH
jgi:hypothetical protein